MQWFNKWCHAFKQSLSHTSRCTMLFDLLLPWCIIMYSLNLSMIFIIFSISLILFQFIWFSQICHFDCHVDRTRPWFNRISTSWMFILLKLFVITFYVIILARRNFHFGSQFKKLVKEKYILTVQCKFFERQENCTSFKLVHWKFVVR